ncbi:MAG: hypothetical protein Q8P39_01215 [Candidatus Yanofskybacteria bacterium]|nr:hypothetical protein [Candidatus Yanofskybacteria bacterium]
MVVSMQKTTNVGILGYGEVGQAIAKFYSHPKIKDLKRDDGLGGVDILHVCIPWSDTFLPVVRKAIQDISPGLVIVHSTVPPGTTKKLGKRAVHSPIRGLHPHLFEGVRTFVKYIGADDKTTGKLAETHLRALGIKTKLMFPSAATEIGKILDTTYYGLCIAWHGEMKKICDRLGVAFEDAVTNFNETYNEGYITLGKTNVVRPVLYPPQEGIGGHCVIPNAKILSGRYQSEALDLILKYGAKEKKRGKK